MKLKTTKSAVKNNFYYILSIGYCDAQRLLNYEKAFGYSAGVYGWACDYYEIEGVCISTGYSPLSDKNMKGNYNLVREYEAKAEGKSRDERHALLVELIEQLKVK